jgi:hypothetical protein
LKKNIRLSREYHFLAVAREQMLPFYQKIVSSVSHQRWLDKFLGTDNSVHMVELNQNNIEKKIRILKKYHFMNYKIKEKI